MEASWYLIGLGSEVSASVCSLLKGNKNFKNLDV
jgi:hypothetical protein